MKCLYFVLIFILYFNNHLLSLTMQEWVYSYGGKSNNYDEGIDIVVDNADNIFVGGNIMNDEHSDIVLIKYNPGGQVQWAKTYDGYNGEDKITDIDIDQAGNVFLVGYSESPSGIYDHITIKYNTNGDLLWAKRYNKYPALHDAISSSVFIDKDNFVYAAGTTRFSEFSGFLLLIKYSPSGDTLWTTGEESPAASFSPINIYVDSAKIVYLAKGHDGFGVSMHRYINGVGGLFMATSEGGLPTNNCFVVNNSAYYCAGFGIRPPAYISDYFILKFIHPGSLNRRFYDCMAANRHDTGMAVIQDNIGNLYITGKSCDQGNCFVSTVKFDSNLVVKWERVFTNNTNEFSGGNGILSDKLGNIYITGSNEDYLTIKYKPNGDSVWVQKYNGKGNGVDISNAIAMDSSGNIIITGRSQISENNYDIVTVKYSQQVNIFSYETEIPAEFILLQNFPNPFNPETIINYKLSAFHNVNLVIYDIKGKEISSIVNKKQSSGDYKVYFDGRNLPSGIYFCRLYIDNKFVDSKKMILLK